MKHALILLISYAVLLVQLVFAPGIDFFIVGIVVSVFFYSDTDSLAFASIGGVLRDFFYPLFGIHIVLYPLIAIVGLIVIKTVITHRTLWGYIGLSIGTIFFADVLKVLMLLASTVFFHGQGSSVFFGLKEIAYLASSSIGAFGICLLAYIFFDKMHHMRRYGIVLDRV